MAEPINQLTLTDAVIRDATLPQGKAQHYLHDDKLPGLGPAHARYRWPDVGLSLHQAGGEGDPAKDPRCVAEV